MARLMTLKNASDSKINNESSENWWSKRPWSQWQSRRSAWGWGGRTCDQLVVGFWCPRWVVLEYHWLGQGQRGSRLARGSVEKLENNVAASIWCGARRTFWPELQVCECGFQIETDSHGKHTEHLCYDCWPKSPTVPRPDIPQHVDVHWAEWAEVEQSQIHGVSQKVLCSNNARNVHREVSDSAPMELQVLRRCFARDLGNSEQ